MESTNPEKWFGAFKVGCLGVALLMGAPGESKAQFMKPTPAPTYAGQKMASPFESQVVPQDQMVPLIASEQERSAQQSGGTAPGASVAPIVPVTAVEEEASADGVADVVTEVTGTELADAYLTVAYSDPAAFSGIKGAIDFSQLLRSIRTANLPTRWWEGTNSLVFDTIGQCIAKERKNNTNLSDAEAQDKCLASLVKIGTGHQLANPAEPNHDENTLRFTTLAFLSNKEFKNETGGDMPFQESSDADSLKESFQLTSEAFCSIYGDVLITAKSDPQTKVISTQLQRIDPWMCRNRDPKTDAPKLTNRNQLLTLCQDPVSLEVNRYCRAMYYYDLIKWTMQSQCVAFNNSALPGPRAHLPMLPRNEQDCSSGNFLSSPECPGPWGVTRKDWDRTQEDLSLPGYRFTRGTAEAFFWAYRREMPMGGGSNIFGTIGSIFSNPLSLLSSGSTLLCGDLGPTGRAEFTAVANNWKSRHPVWVKAAMRFANARALLWTRDLTIQAWSVIQGFSSTMNLKDLSSSAKQLLTNAYDREDEATVQKQLEWTAQILQKMELEADLARKSGTGVVGNAS